MLKTKFFIVKSKKSYGWLATYTTPELFPVTVTPWLFDSFEEARIFVFRSLARG